MPTFPVLPQNPDLQLVEAVTGDMLGRLARVAHDFRQAGMTRQNQQEIRRYAEKLLHFTAEGMPIRRS